MNTNEDRNTKCRMCQEWGVAGCPLHAGEATQEERDALLARRRELGIAGTDGLGAEELRRALNNKRENE